MILALKPCATAAASKVVAVAADIFGQRFSDKIDHKDSIAARKTQAVAILFSSRRDVSIVDQHSTSTSAPQGCLRITLL
jgi:hypothetical protein